MISGKFICGCIGFGTVAVLGYGALLVTGTSLSVSQASSSFSDQKMEAVFTEGGSFLRDASSNLSPKFKAFSEATDAFVSSNATTARLQFDGMANTVTSHLSLEAWIPGAKPRWTQGGVEVAAKATTGQAIALAGKIPAVNAVRSNMEHLSELHPALHIGAPGF